LRIWIRQNLLHSTVSALPMLNAPTGMEVISRYKSPLHLFGGTKR
jgi:hypothetical protein